MGCSSLEIVITRTDPQVDVSGALGERDWRPGVALKN